MIYYYYFFFVLSNFSMKFLCANRVPRDGTPPQLRTAASHLVLCCCLCLIKRTTGLYELTPLLKNCGLQGLPIVLIFDPKHRLWVLVRTAASMRFKRVPKINVLSKYVKISKIFQIIFFHFKALFFFFHFSCVFFHNVMTHLLFEPPHAKTSR